MSTKRDSEQPYLQHVFCTPRPQRIYTLGMQIAQLYLSPFDQIIGFIGEAGSGKSVLIKGMFPGIELTNDDDGVNVRPLPLLEQEYETGFFTPHTYHLDIRFETGFHQLSELADAVQLAVRRGKRIIIEHFDLIYPLLGVNANLLIGVGEQIVITQAEPLWPSAAGSVRNRLSVACLPPHGAQRGGSVRIRHDAGADACVQPRRYPPRLRARIQRTPAGH